MKKRYWKKRAAHAERQLGQVQERTEITSRDLRWQIAELTRELEDKRKNWAPIKIKHPYEPRDATCKFCDDPQEDPRHG